MPNPPDSIQSLRLDVSRFLDVTQERHRRGEGPFRVCAGLSDGIDGILRQLFAEQMAGEQDRVALIAIGGYGRRELCPRSDIDLLFLRESPEADDRIKKLVTLLWDGGFDLGHSVRTLAECYRYMTDDDITAAALMENRFLTGSKKLFARFEVRVINKYRKKLGETFARRKFEQLHASLDAPDRTIWVLEPHLKEGLGGLRDVQRVLWIEKMRHGHGTFEEFRGQGVFDSERIDALRDAYGFQLRVRCENHFVHGMRQDIVESESILDVARNLGYVGSPRETVGDFMADYYRHARGTYRFLRYYLETGAKGRRFLGRLQRKIFATVVKEYLLLYQQRLYLKQEPEVSDLAEEIVSIFKKAHELDVRVSESLCEWIRQKLRDEDLDFRGSTAIRKMFLSILREGSNCGRVLKTMHKTGVLGRIVPEFSQIDGLVDFGGYHHYTVDEHTLRTLVKLDRIERTDDPPDLDSGQPPEDYEFHRVLERVKDKLPLRLAMLLHDIGKAWPGDHSVSGSDVAVLICENLGVDEKMIETVEFLVYRHLRMFKVSQRQEFSEPSVVESFARLVGTEDRLDMLYVLTYIDICSVGPGAWTSWKGVQLAELYQLTKSCLKTGTVLEIDLEEMLVASDLAEADRERVKAHCEQLDSSGYVREIVPERMLSHVELIDKLVESGKAQVGHKSFSGYHELVFCCGDRPRLFVDLTGILLSEGLTVLGARILSRKDRLALDLFHVAVADGINIPIEERIDRVKKKVRQVDEKSVLVEDMIRQWLRVNRYSRIGKAKRPLYGPSVKVHNELSQDSTVVEVNAGDRPGLLHDEASALSRLGLDIRSAKISTVGNRARDFFYVVEADGQMVTNPARITQIKNELEAQAKSPGPALLQGGQLY